MKSPDNIDIASKYNMIKSLSILEVAAQLGVGIVADRCKMCFNKKKDTDEIGAVEFNVHQNTYRCTCMNQRGDIIDLVQRTKDFNREEAIEWLFKNFIMKITK